MSDSRVWLVIALVAVSTMAIKGIGPAAVGSKPLPAPVLRVVALLAAALLSGLVVTQALADGGRLRLGADTAGVAVAGVLLWRRAPLLVAIGAAAAVAAGLRLLGVDP